MEWKFEYDYDGELVRAMDGNGNKISIGVKGLQPFVAEYEGRVFNKTHFGWKEARNRTIASMGFTRWSQEAVNAVYKHIHELEDK